MSTIDIDDTVRNLQAIGGDLVMTTFQEVDEPANRREFVALYQRLGVGPGIRILDVGCGSGLALEVAAGRLASCAGIDASPRLLEAARDRNPRADLRLGDEHALPWGDATFDVVTSFRGIRGTTPDAIAEVHRVLAPGGRVGITVWGHNLGVGEGFLARLGFVDVKRFDIPVGWGFADPSVSARAFAYDALQAAGKETFMRFAAAPGHESVGDGLARRAPIAVAGYVARKPARALALVGAGERRPAVT